MMLGDGIEGRVQWNLVNLVIILRNTLNSNAKYELRAEVNEPSIQMSRNLRNIINLRWT
jgi:hypothetical protein